MPPAPMKLPLYGTLLIILLKTSVSTTPSSLLGDTAQYGVLWKYCSTEVLVVLMVLVAVAVVVYR